MGRGLVMVAMGKIRGGRGICLGYFLWGCWGGLFIVLVCRRRQIGEVVVRMGRGGVGEEEVEEGRDLEAVPEEEEEEVLMDGMNRRRRILGMATNLRRAEASSQLLDSNNSNKDGDRGSGRD